jgi:hypothetical protein
VNMIPPITILPAMLHASSITEPSSSESNGVTALTVVTAACAGEAGDGTYNLIFSGGSPSHTATGTYTIASNVITATNLTYGGEYYASAPTVATQSGNGHIDAVWVDGNYRGEWAVGSSYSVNAIVSYLPGHRMYKSLQNTNIGYTPGGAGNSTWWQDWGATERWVVFDEAVGVQAEAPTQITYEILPGEAIDSVALLNIEADSITVIMKDGLDGAVVKTWHEHTLIDGLFVSDVVETTFSSAIADPHILISIDYAGGTAKLGEIVVGLKESLGTTRYTPSVSITDYSIKEVDAFGNYTILERAYSKRLSCETFLPNTSLDAIYNVLAEHRALPAVWVGSEDYASMIVYGFYKDFEITIPYPKFSLCTLEIEGLV